MIAVTKMAAIPRCRAATGISMKCGACKRLRQTLVADAMQLSLTKHSLFPSVLQVQVPCAYLGWRGTSDISNNYKVCIVVTIEGDVGGSTCFCYWMIYSCVSLH